MRWILALFLSQSMFLVCCVSQARPAPPAPPPLEPGYRTPAEQSAAAVEVTRACVMPDGEVSVGFGSGTVLSEWTVLTASHVVACDGKTALMVVAGGKAHLATVAATDELGDMTILLLTDQLKGGTPRLGPKPAVGQRVCLAVARPGPDRKCGTVREWVSLPGDVRHDAPTIPGNSGGGVYDAQGRLVGVITHYVACAGRPCGGLFTAVEGRLEEKKKK